MELNLTWRDEIGNVNYSANLNGAYNKTNLEEWNEFLNRGWIFIGMPYHFLYTYENHGMAQTWEDIYNHTPQSLVPGDVLREDLNGDGIIDGKDRRAYPNIQRDRPTTTFGMTFTAEWKGFDISALFNGATGRYRLQRYKHPRQTIRIHLGSLESTLVIGESRHGLGTFGNKYQPHR